LSEPGEPPHDQAMATRNEVVCGEVQHGTEAYALTVALRDAVLRKPLGLVFDPQELAQECDSFHLACRLDGNLVGCVVLKPPLDNRHVRLRQMAVAKEYQRMGVGTRLIAHAEAFLGRRGYRQIVLHARETAMAFYERLGYRKEGDRFIEVTIPHFAMRKELPACEDPKS
jgi:ribosomal protein S18 acetylase RimI-like enzyme